MPENENPNSYNYNPNRPQNNSDIGSNQENEHADTKKVVDTAAKGAAEYFAPGVGGLAYDAAKKAPIVGDAIDKTIDKVAETADKIPGVKKVTQGLNDSGITDTASKAMDLVSNKGAGNLNGANNLKNAGEASKNVARNSNPINGDAQVKAPIRKNTFFNSMMQNNEEDENRGLMLQNDEASINSDRTESFDSSNNSGGNLDDKQDEQSQNTNNNNTDFLGKGLHSVWKKYKIPIILGGGGLFFIFLILIIILGGGVQEAAQNMGYYDNLCNYNDTKVTLTNCYLDDSEKEELSTFELSDFVINMTYAYSKDKNYSDETLKALMVALKTNALSYGNYNSSDKYVEVRICDIFSNYNKNNEANDDLWMLDGIDENMDNLSNLYNEVSNYLYISSSYRSTISTLSKQNALNLNDNLIADFENLASEGNNYSQILNAMYNSDEAEDNDLDNDGNIFKETLFLGDSRTRGMQNAGVINSGNTIYGVGYGYNWLIGSGTFSSNNTNATIGGINGINGLIRDNTSYNIVMWLGVNDLGNVDAYYQKYYDLASNDWSNHNIYIVSVGPVDDSLSLYAKNEAINNFNSTMANLINSSGLNNLFYLDLGYTEESIKEYDGEGIHYSSTDYKKIYEIIMSNLDSSLNADYQLYNLTTYCTYYTLTENDAYWWPVGSKEATQGNIYGGEPTSTIITSKFGRRNTGIAGASTNHKGIDISKNGSSCGDVVIASRAGTVIAVTDNGGARGTYIKIDHGDGVVTLYQHMIKGSYTVNLGDTVKQGQKIGLIGNTGVGSGCHLHFEVIVNGVQVDPLDYVDPENPRPISSSDINVSLSGNSDDNKNMVCMTLLNSGFSENAVAGMMVNLQAESGFSPINLQNSYENSLGFTDSSYTLAVDNGSYSANSFVHDSAGYGLAQWTYYSRKQNLYNYAKSRNTSIGDLGMQLEFFVQELQGYSDVYKYVTGNYSADNISTNFCLSYENPKNASTTCPNRTNTYLEEIINYVKNGCS